MARYLIGPNRDTWDFEPALQAAKSGDILEFQKDYSPVLRPGKMILLDKELTFEGHIHQEGDSTTFLNHIEANFQVAKGITFRFHNLSIASDYNNTLISTEEGATVHLDNVRLQCPNEKMQYSLYYGHIDSTLVANRLYCTRHDNHRDTLIFNHAKGTIDNSVIDVQTRMHSDSNVTIRRSDLSIPGSNTLHIKNSVATIEDSIITGGDVEEEYPIVWIEDSQVIMNNNTITNPGHNSAVNVYKNSKLEVNHTNVTSLRIDDARVRAQDLVIKENLTVTEHSYFYSKGSLSFLGDNESRKDILATYGSAVVIDHISYQGHLEPYFESAHGALLSYQSIDLLHPDKQPDHYEVEGGRVYTKASKQASSPAGSGPSQASGQTGQTEESALAQLNHLIGLNKVKLEVQKMLEMHAFNQRRIAQGYKPEVQALHAIFSGNPGTGKTTVARLVGRILHEAGALQSEDFRFVEVTESDLVSSYVGRTAEQTLEVLEKAKGGVLFIDEAYALNKKGATIDHGIEAINTILKYMEDHRSEIMIIFAGYTKEMNQFLKLNEGLASRVPNNFEFEDYSPAEIVQMGLQILEDRQYVLEDPAYYEQVVTRLYKNSLDKSNGRWIRNLNEKLLKEFASRCAAEQSDDVTRILKRDIEVLVEGQRAGLQEDPSQDAYQQLDRLIGIPLVKEQVNQFIDLAALNRMREDAGQTNADFSLHSLFLGNPGTGKTTVARIVGKILYQKGIIAKNKLVEVSRTDLVAGYIGQTAAKTREVLESALGGVLFIDEAYTLYSGMANDFGLEAVNEILKFMEDHRRDIVIIFAGYTKEMADFLNMNSGLKSRIPNSFDFQDYSVEELIQIGLLDLGNNDYKVDPEAYGQVVQAQYAMNFDHSNGRWIRNLNEKLIRAFSTRVVRSGSSDFTNITQADLEAIKED